MNTNTVICSNSSSMDFVDTGTCESVEVSYTRYGKEELYANIACGNPGLFPLVTPLLLVQT